MLVSSELKHHFTLLGKEMQKGRTYREKELLELRPEDHRLSEELKAQIERVCQIEGGRQVICDAQKPIWELLKEKSF